MSHLNQFDMNLIESLIYVPIQCGIAYLFKYMFECLSVSMLVLKCDLFPIYSIYASKLANSKTYCEFSYPI